MGGGLEYPKGRLTIVLLGIHPKRAGYVKRGLNRIWDFTQWEYEDYKLLGRGMDWILGDFSDTLHEIARTATRLNKAGVHIEVYVEEPSLKVMTWDA